MCAHAHAQGSNPQALGLQDDVSTNQLTHPARAEKFF